MARLCALRFPSPLIKPDVQFSRVRLSDRLHHKARSSVQQLNRSVIEMPAGTLRLALTTQYAAAIAWVASGPAATADLAIKRPRYSPVYPDRSDGVAATE